MLFVVLEEIMYLYARMMVPGQIYPDVLNMSLVYRSRYLAPVLEFLDTVHRDF